MMFESESVSSSSRSLSSRYFRSSSGSYGMQYSISNITDDDSWLVNAVTKSDEDTNNEQQQPRAFRNFPPPKVDVNAHHHSYTYRHHDNRGNRGKDSDLDLSSNNNNIHHPFDEPEEADHDHDNNNNNGPLVFRNFPPPKLDVAQHHRVKGAPNAAEKEYRNRNNNHASTASNSRVTIRSESTEFSAIVQQQQQQQQQRKSYRFSFQGEDGSIDNLTTPVRKNSSSKSSPFTSSSALEDHIILQNLDPKTWYSKMFGPDDENTKDRTSTNENKSSKVQGQGRGTSTSIGWWERHGAPALFEDLSKKTVKGHGQGQRGRSRGGMIRDDATNDTSSDSLQSVYEYISSAVISVTKSASSLEQKLSDHLFPHGEKVCCPSFADVEVSTESGEYINKLQRENGFFAGSINVFHYDDDEAEDQDTNLLSREEVLEHVFSSCSDDGSDIDDFNDAVDPKDEGMGKGGDKNGSLLESSYKLDRTNKNFLRSSGSDLRKHVDIAVAGDKSSFSFSEVRDNNFEESKSGSTYFDQRQADLIDQLNHHHDAEDYAVEPSPINARERYLYPLQPTMNQVEPTRESSEGIKEARDDGSESPVANYHLLGTQDAPSKINECDNTIYECGSTKTMVRSLGGKSLLPASVCKPKSPKLAMQKKKLLLSKLISTGDRGNWKKKIYS